MCRRVFLDCTSNSPRRRFTAGVPNRTRALWDKFSNKGFTNLPLKTEFLCLEKNLFCLPLQWTLWDSYVPSPLMRASAPPAVLTVSLSTARALEAEVSNRVFSVAFPASGCFQPMSCFAMDRGPCCLVELPCVAPGGLDHT